MSHMTQNMRYTADTSVTPSFMSDTTLVNYRLPSNHPHFKKSWSTVIKHSYNITFFNRHSQDYPGFLRVLHCTNRLYLNQFLIFSFFLANFMYKKITTQVPKQNNNKHFQLFTHTQKKIKTVPSIMIKSGKSSCLNHI